MNPLLQSIPFGFSTDSPKLIRFQFRIIIMSKAEVPDHTPSFRFLVTITIFFTDLATFAIPLNFNFRFSGRFHRRSIRRGSKYKMQHRSPTELSKVKMTMMVVKMVMVMMLVMVVLMIVVMVKVKKQHWAKANDGDHHCHHNRDDNDNHQQNHYQIIIIMIMNR